LGLVDGGERQGDDSAWQNFRLHGNKRVDDAQGRAQEKQVDALVGHMNHGKQSNVFFR